MQALDRFTGNEADPPAPLRIGKTPGNARLESGHVASSNEEAALSIADDVGATAALGRYDGESACHSFQDDEPKGIREGGEHEEIALLVVTQKVLLGNGADAPYG